MQRVALSGTLNCSLRKTYRRRSDDIATYSIDRNVEDICEVDMSGKFQKYASASGGRTMWQIVWTGDGEDGEDADGDVTVVDASNLEYNSDSPYPVGGAVVAAASNDEEVVFDRTKSKPKTNGTYTGVPVPGTRSLDLNESEMQIETPGEFTGRNFLMRRDSDSDLILKASASSQLSARIKYCWLNCRNPVFWRTYWWLPLTIVMACVIYVVVIVTIVFTMRD